MITNTKIYCEGILGIPHDRPAAVLAEEVLHKKNARATRYDCLLKACSAPAWFELESIELPSIYV